MAELEPAEKHAISHRGRAARALAEALGRARRGRAVIRTKAGAAGLSIASNAILIVLKLAAGAITGSIAIITEAIHSAIDLLASVVAFFSRPRRRRARRPRAPLRPREGREPRGGDRGDADPGRRRDHHLRGDPAAGRSGSEIEDLGVGIAVIAFSAVANIGVSTFLYRRARALEFAGARGRRRSPAHRRADLGRRAARPAARRDHRRARVRRDRRARGRRGDRDRRRPDPDPLEPGARRRGAAARRARPDRGGDRRRAPPRPEIAGYHKLRARGAGARRYIDLHLQFRSGTTLEDAHAAAHAVREAIERELPQVRGPDPQRARAVAAARGARRGRPGEPVQSRLIAAAAPTAVTTIE